MGDPEMICLHRQRKSCLERSFTDRRPSGGCREAQPQRARPALYMTCHLALDVDEDRAVDATNTERSRIASTIRINSMGMYKGPMSYDVLPV